LITAVSLLSMWMTRSGCKRNRSRRRDTSW